MIGGDEDWKALVAAGWTQGSVLPSGLHADAADRLQMELDLQAQETDHFIVVSHPCDVVNASWQKEPWVECLRLQTLKKSVGFCEDGENSRELHFLLGSQVVKALAVDRFRLLRRQLAQHTPDDSRMLDAKTCRTLAAWLSRRYHRSAFPDAFNDRLPKKKDVVAVLEKHKNLISAVYCALSSAQDRELAADEKYSPLFILAVPVDKVFDRACAEYLQSDFRNLFDQSDWTLEVQVLAENEITLHDFRSLRQLEYDYLSQRHPESPNSVPRWE